jgi:AcrR family transcriptional regulator
MLASIKAVRGSPLLSKARIIDKALILLDKAPLSELTMRKLADSLNISPGALYRYFPSQDLLFEAIGNRVIEGVDLYGLEHEDDWRVVLKKWAVAYRKQQLLHPNTVVLVQMRQHVPAKWFEISEPLIAALASAGLSGYVLVDTLRSFSRFVVGSVITELVYNTNSLDIERKEAEMALDELSPRARLAVGNIIDYLGDQNSEALFDFSVDLAIRGIEASLQSATG